MTAIDGDLLRGHLETMILSVLSAREGHGYEVMQRLEVLGAGTLSLKEGTLYPILYRLEGEGLLRSKWQPSADGPRRRVYRTTDKGTRELTRRRQTWREFVQVVGDIVVGTNVEVA